MNISTIKKISSIHYIKRVQIVNFSYQLLEKILIFFMDDIFRVTQSTRLLDILRSE